MKTRTQSSPLDDYYSTTGISFDYMNYLLNIINIYTDIIHYDLSKSFDLVLEDVRVYTIQTSSIDWHIILNI